MRRMPRMSSSSLVNLECERRDSAVTRTSGLEKSTSSHKRMSVGIEINALPKVPAMKIWLVPNCLNEELSLPLTIIDDKYLLPRMTGSMRDFESLRAS